MANAINWFELPATNFDRAVKFYNEVLGDNLQPMDHPQMKMAFFPAT
jgi:predicted enzyme related to lactoylglutathione lyase